MDHNRLGSDAPISQLLEILEKRLDNITAASRYAKAFGPQALVMAGLL
jgi:hypothetical protein